jgi:hypothetical protein
MLTLTSITQPTVLVWTWWISIIFLIFIFNNNLLEKIIQRISCFALLNRLILLVNIYKWTLFIWSHSTKSFVNLLLLVLIVPLVQYIIVRILLIFELFLIVFSIIMSINAVKINFIIIFILLDGMMETCSAAAFFQ